MHIKSYYIQKEKNKEASIDYSITVYSNIIKEKEKNIQFFHVKKEKILKILNYLED